VRVEERFFRPADVDSLVGDAAKARRVLGWEPTVTFEGLVTMMVENDLRTEARNIERRRREEPVSATSPDGLS
jgi:GDPmannose 4,6-dehydratase